MSLQSDILSSLSDIIAWEGNPTFTWNGEDYPCGAGSAGNALVLGQGGFERQADLVLFVATNSFADSIYPQSKQLITYNGLRYRIDRVNQDPMGATLKLVLISDTRGI